MKTMKIKAQLTYFIVTWPAVIVCLAGLLLFTAFEAGLKIYGEKLLLEKQDAVRGELAVKKDALGAAINRHLGEMKGLAAFGEAVESEEMLALHFEEFASGLFESKGIRALILAPGGVHRYVYPVKGNEAVLGRNVLDNPRPEQREAIQRTITTGEVVLNGPYKLLQGGMGLVIRKAVYREDALWGLVVMILDVPDILSEAGLEKDTETLSFALRSEDGQVFHGDKEVFQRTPISVMVPLPQGYWEVSAAPMVTWEQWLSSCLLPIRIVGYSICLLLLVLFSGILFWQRNLQETVKLRTFQLQKKTDELNEMVNRLADSNQDLEQFAYVVSHDLKAPLRGIRNLSQWIEEDLQSRPLDDSLKENLELLRSRVNRMEELIQGILQYSRAGRMEMEMAVVDTEELVREIWEELSPSEDIVLYMPQTMPIMTTSKIMFKQVLENILGNAIIHRDIGKKLTITIAIRNTAQYYEWSVSDTGAGIDPKYHEKIFEIFQKVHSAGASDGTGIGLAIVKKLVQQAGGTISLRSQPGEGSTFIFTWPKVWPTL